MPSKRLSDVQSSFLLGSSKLPSGSNPSASVGALVLPQPLAVDEALPTLAALVGSLSRVKPVVHLQFLGSGVAFPADAADERPLFNVSLVVCCQIGVDAEGLPADGARVGPLPRVAHLMQLEGGSGVEASAALGAEEGFLPGVNALVDLDVALVDELLPTVGAGVALLLRVGLHVLLQLVFVGELDAAAAAEDERDRAALCRLRLAALLRVGRHVMGLQSRLTLAFLPTFQAMKCRFDLGFSRQRL